MYSTIPVFWLLIHSPATYWRSRPRSPYRVLIPAWIAMWIALAVVTSPWRRARLHAAPSWFWIPAATLFAAGLWLYKKSGVNFNAQQLAGLPELRTDLEKQHLLTSGIRSRVRHPVYLSHLCEMLAWSLAKGLVVCYLLTAVAIFTGALMIRSEEGESERRFGDSYGAYRNSVPALLPKL